MEDRLAILVLQDPEAGGPVRTSRVSPLGEWASGSHPLAVALDRRIGSVDVSEGLPYALIVHATFASCRPLSEHQACRRSCLKFR